MGALRSAVGVLLGLLGGCGLEADVAEGQASGTTGSVEDTQARGGQASRLCDGTWVEACEGPFTGATCDLPCVGDAAGEVECGIDRTCHSDGSTYGLSARNAVLFGGSADDDDEVVQAAFEAWIVEHPADLGLAAGVTVEDLGLHRLHDFRSSAGRLTIVRFRQTYRGLPVLAPDGIVTLVYGPQGAIAITGAIIDGRTPYEHADAQASAAKAFHSMIVHADAQEARASVQGLEVVHATRMAMPMAKAIGWVGFVRFKGGGTLARVIVDADPTVAGPLLPLWEWRPVAVPGLPNTQPVEVHTVDPAGEPKLLSYAEESLLTTGAPLLGSVDDVSLSVQLATERVVVLDLHGQPAKTVASSATRVLSPSGEFLAGSGAGLSAQVAYHLFQSWYDFIDGRLTDPAFGAKRWDSATFHYSGGGVTSDAPPGTFAPRVLAFVNASPEDCSVGTACASHEGYAASNPIVTVFPELLHIPVGATKPEALGLMTIPGTGIHPVIFAHELGHIVDLFTGGGMTIDLAPACQEPCALECIEDTTDEAPPLTESIAQLLALAFLLQSFEGVTFDYCDIVDMVAVNGNNAWTPGTCIPAGQDISVFQRSTGCTKPSLYCDKPDEPGTSPRCCFDDQDLSDCTLHMPEVCEVGAVGQTGGIGTGTARPAPTGMCDATPGYQTNSLYQAFWQMLNGQVCEPVAPFSCVSVAWAPGMTPLDAATDALLYAMRVKALSYEQLFDAMATYVSCTYGTDAYDAFNQVACSHGIRACDEPAPLVCQACGNGVREGNEGCDGTDWLLTRCEDLPLYSGGTLACDQATCVLDPSQCSMPGLDTTAGTAPLDETSSSASTGSTDTDTAGAGGIGADGGCGCRARALPSGWIMLVVLLLGARRRGRIV